MCTWSDVPCFHFLSQSHPSSSAALRSGRLNFDLQHVEAPLPTSEGRDWPLSQEILTVVISCLRFWLSDRPSRGVGGLVWAWGADGCFFIYFHRMHPQWLEKKQIRLHFTSYSKMSSFRDWNSTIKLQLTAGGGERSICFMQISA